MISPIIIKVGGKTFSDEKKADLLAQELSTFSGPCVVVHGGGILIDTLMTSHNSKPLMKDGIRITRPSDMCWVDMALLGEANISLVRRFCSWGIRALGISGSDASLITPQVFLEPPNCRTAHVKTCNPRLIWDLLEHGYLPVVASVSHDKAGRGVNINADEVALSLAVSLESTTLVFLSDIEGIEYNGSVQHLLPLSKARKILSSSQVHGGMKAKLSYACQSVEKNIQKVIIGGLESKGDLLKILAAERGSHLYAD